MKLLPCPFCGKKPKLVIDREAHPIKSVVECRCGAEMRWWSYDRTLKADVKDLKKSWNTRV